MRLHIRADLGGRGKTLSRALLLGLAALLALVAAWAVEIAHAQNDDEQSGRIVARRLDDGRTEFGWQPVGGERVLPRARYFPAEVGHQRWLNSSPVEVGGAEIGRINARLREDGRIEFAFTPTDGEQILPPSRYFPVGARVGRWLRSTEIVIGVAPATGFVAISVGLIHACAIRAGSGEIECWGDNFAGQINAPPGRFSAVTVGGIGADYTCGLRESGEIECWGARDNRGGFQTDFGQLDPPPGPFSAVSAGGEHACGLRTNGAIECWGTPLNDFGQTTVPSSSDFTAVRATQYNTCGLRENGATSCAPDWTQTDAPADPIIAFGGTCTLRESGKISGCGRAGDAPAGHFIAVSGIRGYYGNDHACAIRESREIECWGSNSAYRWNDETQREEEFYGGQIDAPTGRFIAVGVSVAYSCAIRDTGAIECWGWGEHGQTDPPAP